MRGRTTNESIAAYAGLADILSATGRPVDFAPMGARAIRADELTPRSRQLLDHVDHMTERLRTASGGDLKLTVLREHSAAGEYSREILLTAADGAILEFGVVRIMEQHLPPAVVHEIHRREKPLGDILISHGVLRRVEPRWFFEFDETALPTRAMNARAGDGRLGIIHCNGEPAIQVLEVIPRSH